LVDHKSALFLPIIGFALFIGFTTFYSYMEIEIFNKFNNKMIDEDLYNGAIYSAGFMYIWSVTLV
jgi:hypothetical protein